jgi:exodeoxyribonuclease-3
LKIVSYNLNGLRSALGKGLLDWVAATRPDVLCVQEIKAGTAPLDVSGLAALGYHAYLHPARKPGYSGVATFSLTEPKAVVTGCGEPLYDEEGRVLRLDFEHVSVLNTYMPSGTSGPARQAFKVAWLHWFRAYVARLRQDATVPPLVIGGDFNCCQTAIDLHNPKANQLSPGYTPEERQWFSNLLAAATSTRFGSCTPRRRTTTRGGATEPARGRATWAGASTTCCSTKRCYPSCAGLASGPTWCTQTTARLG